MENTVDISLNIFDDEGNQVDTTEMTLPERSVSDIVDHAAQLMIVFRSMGDGDLGIEAFDQVLCELNESLVNSGVIEELGSEAPVATLHLLKEGSPNNV
jgi:hypothetical protein